MTTHLSKEVYERLANMSYDNIKNTLKQNNKIKKINYSDYQYKSNKYHNKKVFYGDILFDSKKECDYFYKLKMMEKAGIIQELELQKKFELQPSFTDNTGKKQRAINYIADFYYYDKELKIYIAVDVKGYKTDVYRLKKKMFMYKYQNIIFKEI